MKMFTHPSFNLCGIFIPYENSLWHAIHGIIFEMSLDIHEVFYVLVVVVVLHTTIGSKTKESISIGLFASPAFT